MSIKDLGFQLQVLRGAHGRVGGALPRGRAAEEPRPGLRLCEGLRFHRRFCGERMDVWVVRFAEAAPLKFHGLASGCLKV